MARKSPWEKEWNRLIKAEAKYTNKRKDGPMSVLFKKLDNVIPKKLSGLISNALYKAFKMIFNKGTWAIEHTYNRKKKQADYMINVYASEVMESPKTIKKFTRKANSSKFLNLLISFVEGVGMGILGLAILDIPLFIAVVFKTVYEIVLTFGYDYHTTEEKMLILKIIEAAMSDEDDFLKKDREINEIIEYVVVSGDVVPKWEIELDDQMHSSSDSICNELLYTRAIQKIPVVGMLGGLFNPVYVNRISRYAVLKYRRRFLSKKIYEHQQRKN